MERQSATLKNGLTLSYLQAGDQGTPLVLLHGITDGAASYTPHIAHLAKSHRVYAVDMRGHGGSDHADGAYMLTDYADDVIELIGQLVGDEPIILAGHSLGSLVTAAIASRQGVPLLGAFMEDPPLGVGESGNSDASGVTDQFAGLRMLLEAHHNNGGTAEQLSELMAGLPALGDPGKTMGQVMGADQIEIWGQLLMQFDYHALDRIVAGDDIGVPLPQDWLPNIQCPAHILGGNPANGAVISKENLEKAGALIPNGTTTHFDDVGHMIHHSVKDRYLADLEGFIARLAA